MPKTNPEVGIPYVFAILMEIPGWYQVMLPTRPNGSTAWVASSDVKVFGVAHRIVVNRGAHTVELWQGEALVATWPAGVGTSDLPTPTGRFYVLEVIDEGPAPFGPYAIGTSGHSEQLTEFEGGDGRWAIHGTPRPSEIPGEVSHGCVRLRGPDITFLAKSVELAAIVDVVP